MTAFVAVALVLLLPSAASAQDPICDEYPDLPVCNETVGGDGGIGDGGENVGNETAAGDGDDDAVFASVDSGSGSGGELPFTGYPLTPLLLLVLILLATGLAIRAWMAWEARRSADPPGGSPPS